MKPTPVRGAGDGHRVRAQGLALEAAPAQYALTPEPSLRHLRLQCWVSGCRRCSLLCADHRRLRVPQSIIRVEVSLQILLHVENVVDGDPPGVALLLPLRE